MKKTTVSIMIVMLVAAACHTAFAAENPTITGIPGIKVGHYTDTKALRGCTVVVFPPEGAVAAVEVQGSAPGTRETDLLDPVNMVQKVHALVLSGGSAFGLDAAGGVMQWLEEQKIGLDVGNNCVVPIVPAAVLFDLAVGNPRIRPDRTWGHQACQKASAGPVEQGCVGAGTGATVGKVAGMQRAMKGGLGSSLIKLPDGILVGALVAVNALGNIIDPRTGTTVAGTRGDTPGSFLSSADMLINNRKTTVFGGTNTTIGIVATNAALSKTALKKIARMAHDGMARSINPVHTMYDGDTVFAVSVPARPAPVAAPPAKINTIGTAAARAFQEAILAAIDQATSIEGYPSARDWQ